MRCLGASRGEVFSIFLLDALLTAVIGAALGVAIGLGIAALLQSFDISTLGVGKKVTTFEVPVTPLVWTAVLGIVFTLAGAGFPLFKARNVSPLSVLHPRGLGEESGGAYVLRGVNVFLFVLLVLVLPGAYLAMTPLLSEEGRETLVVLAQLGAMLLLFGGVLLVAPGVVRRTGALLLWPLRPLLRLPVFLLTRSLQRNPGRFAASVCGLAVVLLAMVGLKHVTAALRGEVEQFGRTTMVGRLFLKCDPVTVEAAQSLVDVAGVAAVEPMQGRVSQGSFELSGLDPRHLRRAGGGLAQDAELLQAYDDSRAVLVSERLARLRGVHAGDTLPVLTDEGARSYTVLAVTNAAGFFPDERAWAVAHPRHLAHDFCVGDACVDRIVLRLKPGAGVPAVLAQVRQRIPHARWAKPGYELIDYHLRDVTRDFFVFDLLLGLILLLAGVGLINAMTIAAMGRSREVGVLRTLGMRRRSLHASLLLEGLLVALLATAVVWIAALPLGAMVVAGLNEVAGLRAPVVVPWSWMAAVPVIALCVGLLAALVPGLRVVRESPAAAVRYE